MNKLFLTGIIGLVILVIGAVLTAVTTTNFVPGTYLDDQRLPLTTNYLKLDACNSLNLLSLFNGTGNITGDNANNLILGSSQNDIIDGRQGSDCIVGGDGNDQVDGRNGYDICFGGGGNDTFSRCEEIID